MSQLNISPNLKIGQPELQRLIDFLDTDGYRKLIIDQTYSYGIIRTVDDVGLNNFKVEKGTNTPTIKIDTRSYAIDSDGLVLDFPAQDNIAIPAENNWYWLKISHQYSSIEEGTVSIDTQGNLIGVNTKFTEVLRTSKVPTRIRFIGSAGNTLEYDVVDVVDDTNAVLNGVFAAESDLQYAIVGTFSFDHIPTSNQKNIYQYDSCNLEFVLETISNTPPPLTSGKEFYIARVRYVGSTVFIQDKRSDFWMLRSEFRSQTIPQAMRDQQNPVIGVEAIKYDAPNTPRYKNVCYVSWAFYTQNWTIDTASRTFTINGGQGGRFKSTDDFSDGDFDGWRLYSYDGSYKIIEQSTKSGSQINLIVPTLDQDDYFTAYRVVITPDVDDIELWCIPEDLNAQNDFRQIYPINSYNAWVPLTVASRTAYSYAFWYRYKVNGVLTEWRVFQSDDVGYYDEESFEEDGDLKTNPADRTQVSYSSNILGTPFITLNAHPRHYGTFSFNIDLGDNLGVDEYEITFSSSQIDLVVGTAAQIQYITGNITLSNPLLFNCTGSDLRAGNKFVLIFQANIIPNGNAIEIYGNYSGPGDSPIYALSAVDIDYQKWGDQKVVVECYYTGTQWIAFPVEKDKHWLYEIRTLSNIPVNAFDGSGLGQIPEYYGWALCNGQNNTPDLRGRFIVNRNASENGLENIGAVGGSNSFALSKQNLPPHTHEAGSLTTNTDTHTHRIYTRNSGTAVGSHRDAGFNRGGGRELADPLDGKNTNEHSHSHLIVGTTEDGSNDGLSGDPVTYYPNYYVVVMVQRIPKS